MTHRGPPRRAEHPFVGSGRRCPHTFPKQHRPCQQSAVALGGRERHRVEQLHVGRICGGSAIRAGVSQFRTVEFDSRGGILARGGSWDRRRQERPQWVLHAAVNTGLRAARHWPSMWKPGLVRGPAAYRPLNSPALCVTWIMDDVPSPACHSSLGRGRRPVFRKCRTRPSGCLREMSRLLQGLRRCLCTADGGKTPGNGPAGTGPACRECCTGKLLPSGSMSRHHHCSCYWLRNGLCAEAGGSIL